MEKIESLQTEIEEIENSLKIINDRIYKIKHIDKLIDLRNRNNNFYEIAPQILKNKGIKPNTFFNITKDAIGNEATNHFITAFKSIDTKINFEKGEELTNNMKKKLNEEKIAKTKELNKKRAELLKEQTSNPLEKIEFGEGGDVSKIFNYDPKSTTKRISNLVVESLNERKKQGKPTKRGHINFKKTMRHSMGNGGIPYELYYKNKDIKMSKEKPKIYIIVDVSGSCIQFIPLAATLAYAFIYALTEYEIVVYSAGDPSEDKPEDYLDAIKKFEKKDMVGNSVVGKFNRLNDKYIKKNIKNPSILYEEINRGGKACDYSINLIEGLLPIAPQNSIFLTFTDSGIQCKKDIPEYIKSKKFCNNFSNFKNNIFFFNLYNYMRQTTAFAIENFRYSINLNTFYDAFKEKNSLPLCTKSKIPRTNIYPLNSIHKYPENYDEWLQEVLRLIKTSLI